MNIQNFPCVLFKGFYCRVIPTVYNNNILALQLKEVDDGTPVATATTNLVEYTKQMTHCIKQTEKCLTFIKNYSENEGMLEALIRTNIVSKPLTYVSSGYITHIPLVEVIDTNLNKEWLNLLDEKLTKESIVESHLGEPDYA